MRQIPAWWFCKGKITCGLGTPSSGVSRGHRCWGEPRPKPQQAGMVLGCAPQQPPMARTWPQEAARALKRLPTVVKPAEMASRGSSAAGKDGRVGKIQPHESRAVGKRQGCGVLGPVTQPRLLRDRLCGPGASALFSRGETGSSFPPGHAAGRIPPLLFLSPHEHHARLSKLLPGCACNPPTHGCLAPPVTPRTALQGRSRLAPLTDNSVGWDQRSRAQWSRHYTLTKLSDGATLPRSQDQQSPKQTGSTARRSEQSPEPPDEPPAPVGPPWGFAPPCRVCLWVCKTEQGLTLQPWADAEHPPGCPWGSGSWNFQGTGFGLSVVCLRTSVLHPWSCCIPLCQAVPWDIRVGPSSPSAPPPPAAPACCCNTKSIGHRLLLRPVPS
ncbi:uncharacterized protein ACIBXB_009345 isoform 1-T2 [Morphnus guianensis]